MEEFQNGLPPKPAKGEPPAPVKSPDEIAAAVEAEMVVVRCDQDEWALNQLEGIVRGWAVGRREQLDFKTIPQTTAADLKNFAPTYVVPAADRVPIPGAPTNMTSATASRNSGRTRYTMMLSFHNANSWT